MRVFLLHGFDELPVEDSSQPERTSVVHSGAAFWTLLESGAERGGCGFPVQAIETVQHVPEVLQAFVSFLCAVVDFSVYSDIMVGGVAEDHVYAYLVFRRQSRRAS